MRVLVATTAGAGHFGPLVPFADACRRAGHDVLVAAPRSFASSVERRGFSFWPCEDIPPEEWAAVMARLPTLSYDEAQALVIGEVFGRLDARATLPGMLAAIDEWRPDLILREQSEFGSYVAAERRGLPQVCVACGLSAFDELAFPLVLDPLSELRVSVGLPADETGERLKAAPCLSLVPPLMEDPEAPGNDRARFRAASSAPPTGALPSWWGANQDPLVYVTFGSVAGTMPRFASAYTAAVAGVGQLPIRALVTTGEGLDPDSLDSVPANVHLERWASHADVLPQAAVMVCHGGFNTTLDGFTAGVPMVMVPLFADQPDNARRVAALGAGEVVTDAADATAVRDAVSRVLADPSYRQAAARVAEDIAALPPADTAVELLERIAAG